MSLQLIIAPTCNVDRGNFYTPDSHGVFRLQKTVELAKQKPQAEIYIVGGYPISYNTQYSITLAAINLMWLDQYFPEAIPQVVMVDGRANNSIEDVKPIFSSLPTTELRGSQVFYCSHPIHGARVAPAFQRYHTLFNLVDSGESDDIYGPVDTILQWYGHWDPLWEGLLGRTVLNRITNNSANKHNERYQEWRGANEELDEKGFQLYLECKQRYPHLI